MLKDFRKCTKNSIFFIIPISFLNIQHIAILYQTRIFGKYDNFHPFQNYIPIFIALIFSLSLVRQQSQYPSLKVELKSAFQCLVLPYLSVSLYLVRNLFCISVIKTLTTEELLSKEFLWKYVSFQTFQK